MSILKILGLCCQIDVRKIISIVHEGVWTLAVFFKKKKNSLWIWHLIWLWQWKTLYIHISHYVILFLITPVIEHFSRFLDNLYVSFCKMPFVLSTFFFFFCKTCVFIFTCQNLWYFVHFETHIQDYDCPPLYLHLERSSPPKIRQDR